MGRIVERLYRKHILRRRFRRTKIHSVNLFNAGDIISVEFESVGFFTRFKGICIRKNCKMFLDLNSSFLLRNIILGVGVEVHVPVY